jgi:hypothetical protein
MAKKSKEEKIVVNQSTLNRRKAWNALKREDQEVVNRETLIRMLNAVHKAVDRDQNQTRTRLAVDLARGKFFAKALAAYQNAVKVLEGHFNVAVEGNLHQEGKRPSMLIVFNARIFAIQSMNPVFVARLRKRLWAEIALRRQKEGPRQSRKKKVA